MKQEIWQSEEKAMEIIDANREDRILTEEEIT